jgi:hypothetical protein
VAKTYHTRDTDGLNLLGVGKKHTKELMRDNFMIYGVSLTRDKRFAKSWGYQDSDNNIIFVLNQDMMKKDGHKIAPLNFYHKVAKNWRGDETESEEFHIGNIEPLTRYLISIIGNKNLILNEREKITNDKHMMEIIKIEKLNSINIILGYMK